ncbi:hypothetical protein [Agrobacterium rubi]|uniref:hypothetical protein n=1 Tax=Agrobacterium rubi TaxID=28099 RepID=UPI0013F4352D|nr:hypothetical protein [Agrobacterium rubi]MBP1876877.1 hypothetical protein [Agrobacterium rubi]
MKSADASHFFHLLNLQGEALAPPPPARTRNEKLAFLAARTKAEEMTLPTIEDFRRAKNERMKDLRREYAKPRLSR